ncbi:MAG: glycosyltransferase, partial [Chitinophagaceae bacterium]
MSSVPQLAIVAPCYNEEAALKDSLEKLVIKIKELIAKSLVKDSSYLLVVDDGSKDASFKMLQAAVGKHIKVLKLAGNVGHQRALLAGMHWATDKCDVL